MFGQFSWDNHIGKSHPSIVAEVRGTHDRSNHPAGLHLPRLPGTPGLPALPSGMLNLIANAGGASPPPPCPTLPRRRRRPAGPSAPRAVLSALFAADILMIPEALVHGALPWLPTDRLRRVLVLRYRPHTKAGPCEHTYFLRPTVPRWLPAIVPAIASPSRRWVLGRFSAQEHPAGVRAVPAVPGDKRADRQRGCDGGQGGGAAVAAVRWWRRRAGGRGEALSRWGLDDTA